MMQPYDFTWIFGVGMVGAFADAYGIGANDVANSFATSISSGSLSLVQACIIACFTEFLGALLLGASATETIKSGIVDVTNYVETPEMLMMGMMCAVFGSALWVLIATRFGWPVSTTHSVVGAICGMGIAGYGGGAVDWTWDGIIQIIASWFLSPLIAGIIAAVIYTITKYSVLRQVDSIKWGLRLVPVFFFCTLVICIFYIVFKSPGAKDGDLPIGAVVGIAFGVASAVTLFVQFFLVPWLRRKVVDREDLRYYHIPIVHWVKRPTVDEILAEEAARKAAEQDPEKAINEDEAPTCTACNCSCGGKKTLDIDVIAPEPPKKKTIIAYDPVTGKCDWPTTRHNIKEKILAILLHGVRQDVRNIGSERLKSIHAAAEVYEDDAEYMFSYLQVLTACITSFAHGSNDVSNAVGPLATIYYIWQHGAVDVENKVPVPIWILAYGGAAIDVGLSTMGYRLMSAMGNNITLLTPSRGFSAELGAALTVLTCSLLGLPVSTTHCITGATAAVGLCNGSFRAVNWKMLAMCLLSWVVTLPMAGLFSGLLYAFAAYGPSFVYLR